MQLYAWKRIRCTGIMFLVPFFDSLGKSSLRCPRLSWTAQKGSGVPGASEERIQGRGADSGAGSGFRGEERIQGRGADPGQGSTQRTGELNLPSNSSGTA